METDDDRCCHCRWCSDNNNAPDLIVLKNSATRRNKEKKIFRTIFDKFNVGSPKSHNSRKSIGVREYHSVNFRRHVYKNGVKCYRRPRKTFFIPVFHVSRRPDNPFNVKKVVQKLKKKLMTSSVNSQHMTIRDQLGMLSAVRVSSNEFISPFYGKIVYASHHSI